MGTFRASLARLICSVCDCEGALLLGRSVVEFHLDDLRWSRDTEDTEDARLMSLHETLRFLCASEALRYVVGGGSAALATLQRPLRLRKLR